MRLILSILFSLLTLPVFAQCVGENLLDTMTPAKRAELDATVASHPYASGNLWRAQKSDSTIHIMGTIHLSDPRLEDYLKPIWSVVDAADLVLVEANLESLENLKSALLSDQSLLFIGDGPTLPERLTEAEWQQLSTAMTARGMPSFMVSKMRPWYVAITLSMPPCIMPMMAAQNGVDHRIMARAKDQGITTTALEPFDTLFSLFNDADADMGLEMLRAALAVGEDADAMIATMLEAYFTGESRAIWELSRLQAKESTPETPEQGEATFNEMEAKLLTARNTNWMPVILGAAENNGNILIAVGAAHLSGKDGLLYLLEKSGYNLHRVEGF